VSLPVKVGVVYAAVSLRKVAALLVPYPIEDAVVVRVVVGAPEAVIDLVGVKSVSGPKFKGSQLNKT